MKFCSSLLSLSNAVDFLKQEWILLNIALDRKEEFDQWKFFIDRVCMFTNPKAFQKYWDLEQNEGQYDNRDESWNERIQAAQQGQEIVSSLDSETLQKLKDSKLRRMSQPIGDQIEIL